MGLAMNLAQISRLDEEGARAYLEGLRWPEGPICPHCKTVNQATKLEGEKHRKGLWKCRACDRQFTVTIGTLFEDSHLPLKTWLMAFAIMCNAKKGVSALQLKRSLGLGSYQTAWHMAHRIRHAMAQEPLRGLLQGIIEADETYVGGKPRPGDGKKRKHGRGTTKTPVVVLVERGGRARAKVVADVSGPTLKRVLTSNVNTYSTLMTDQYIAYRGVGMPFAGHERVNHSAGEYARGDAHVNTAESFFALLKRGIVGSFHNVSKRHLPRYVEEFSWRWNLREYKDATRTEIALKLTEGCRLMYKAPIGKDSLN